jgi:hypothetical protein
MRRAEGRIEVLFLNLLQAGRRFDASEAFLSAGNRYVDPGLRVPL